MKPLLEIIDLSNEVNILNMQYIISPITTYNEDEFLYETKVGLDSKDMPLHYIVCGLSEDISRERAKQLVELLNSFTVHQVILPFII